MKLRVMIVEDTQIEELLLARAELLDIEMGYEHFSADVPEWVSDKLMQVNSEIETKLKAQKLRKLKNLKSLREALKTKTERRDETDAAIAELEASF